MKQLRCYVAEPHPVGFHPVSTPLLRVGQLSLGGLLCASWVAWRSLLLIRAVLPILCGRQQQLLLAVRPSRCVSAADFLRAGHCGSSQALPTGTHFPHTQWEAGNLSRAIQTRQHLKILKSLELFLIMAVFHEATWMATRADGGTGDRLCFYLVTLFDVPGFCLWST